MALYGMTSQFMDPILNPLLSLGSLGTIIVISVIVSVLTTLIYKFTTDQKRLKELKDEQKNYQEKIKSLRDKPNKAMQIQKEMMTSNMEYMKASMKPMLFTMIPVLLFLGWLGAHLAFMPILPGTNFSMSVVMEDDVLGNVSLVLPDGMNSSSALIGDSGDEIVFLGLSGEAGLYNMILRHDESGEEHVIDVLITEGQEYINPLHVIKSDIFKSVTVSNKKLLAFENVFLFKDLPWIKGFGWLGAYILFSIVLSTTFRKILKIS